MNYVSTYTIFDKDFFQSFSNGGRFAWLPIDNNMVIVFNLRSDIIDSLKKKNHPHINDWLFRCLLYGGLFGKL